MEKVIAYLESPTWLGHAETQQEIYVKILLGLGNKVIVLTPFPSETKRWAREIISAQRERLYIYRLEVPDKKGFAKKFKWLWANRQIKKAEKESGWDIDQVLLTWLDGMRVSAFMAMLTGVLFRYSWVGLYFTPTHFRNKTPISKFKRLRRILSDYALLQCSRCKGIGVVDEGVIFDLKKIKDIAVVFLPELTEKGLIQTEELDEIKQMARGRRIFSLVGHQTMRKGVLEFLRLAQDFPADKGFFLLVGQFAPESFTPRELIEIKQLLETTGRDNCYFKLTKIENALEFNGFLACSDVLYLGYKNYYHSSGILAKAAYFKKPVIASIGYCIGDRVDKYKLGLTVNILNYEEIRAAADKLVEEDFYRTLISGGGFVDYDEQNSELALCKGLQQLLEQD